MHLYILEGMFALLRGRVSHLTLGGDQSEGVRSSFTSVNLAQLSTKEVAS